MNTIFLLPSRLILLALILMQVTIIQAQVDYQMQMDSVFIIPAYKVTTGVLIDRSPDIIEMQDFKLQPNVNNATGINARNWLELFYRLFGSHLNMSSFTYDLTLAHKYLENPVVEQIPLGLIYYHYDKIKDNAVQNGLLSADTVNHIITDISPVGQSPLEVDTCLAASSLVDTIPIGMNVFILKDSLFISNRKSDIQEIYVDFDNGQGYVRVFPNLPVAVSYTSTGKKILKLKTVIGMINYFSTFFLYVIATQAAYNGPTPDFGPEEYRYNSGNIDIKAWYGIWYRCNHDNTIRKPLLIVSGFDPDDKNRIASEGDQKNKVYLYNVANKDGFLDHLREMGYDIIVYRSKNSTESVIDNAMNLVNFMQEKIINVKTSDIELIVMGASMGGLVCRYALTYMEHNNIPHKTKLFISMDSPQNGANIPLGFQYLLYYINQNSFEVICRLKDALKNMLDSPAAKEMLLYHHSNTSGGTARSATERTTYLNNLALIGNFPQKCRTMAVSMGSGISTTQGFSAGATLLKKNPGPNVIDPLSTLETFLEILGIISIPKISLSATSWEFEVKAVPNQTSGEI